VKVAIAGAGVAGRFLRRLIYLERGVVGENEVDIFDIGNTTGCKTNPCAWMVPFQYFEELMKVVELDPSLYILQRFDKFKMGDKVYAAELQTINKSRLLDDLWDPGDVIEGSPVVHKYDRVIDCTGVQRAFLPAPPPEGEVVIPCVQLRGIPHAGQIPFPMIKFVPLGYAWAFPLGDLPGGGCHIGCGSLQGEPLYELQQTGFLDLMAKKECACTTGRVRLSGPHLSEPFTTGKGTGHEVWGCGESIGCVSPIIGEGIVPAMACACRLVENWNNADNYTSAVMRQFAWMNDESVVLQRLLRGDRLTTPEALILANNASRIGVKIGLTEALDMIKRIL